MKLTAITFLLALFGCGAAKEIATTTVGALVDCTRQQTAATVRELRPLMGVVLAHAVDSGGRLNYSNVRELAAGYATDVARCAIADGIARLVNPPPEDPGAPKIAPLQVDRDAAQAGFRELYPGVRFKTEAGEI
jgi:hypothetical protein